MAKNIRVGVKLDKSGFQKELNRLLEKGYNLNLDSGNFKSVINEVANSTDKLKNKLNNVGKDSFNDVTKSAKESMKVFNDYADAMGRVNEISQERAKNRAIKEELAQAKAINKALDEQYKKEQRLIEQLGKANEVSQKRAESRVAKEELAQAKAINRTLDEQYKKQLSLNNLKEQLSNKIDTAAKNSFIDDSVIKNLRNQLNGLTTDSSTKEINKLKTAINNLSSSDGGIVRVQQAIVRLEERINKIKDTKLDLMTSNELSELKLAENELEKLRSILASLKSGDVIDGKTISNQINITNNSVRTLENSMKELNTIGSGLATTFKEIFSYALGGSGLYLALNSMREAINTTISLDDAMRDLRRISEETENTYAEFMKTANQTAIELGSTTAGAIEATTTFKALGYSFKESSEYMSKMSMILSNVGDMSASDAASSLVSILKGFRLEAEETTKIVDVLNEAG